MTIPVTRRPRRKRGWVLALVVVLASIAVAAVVLALATDFDMWQPEVKAEARNDAVQLLLVGFLSAGLTAAIANVLGALEDERQETLRKREEEQRDYEYRLQFLRSVTGAYNDMKAVRRTLMARGFRDVASSWSEAEDIELFGQMEKLNQAQLVFEACKREARVRSAAFQGAPQAAAGTSGFYREIQGHLKSIEEYVNRILRDWEDQSPSSQRDSLSRFLGAPDELGGIRAGWGTDDGPSARLRNMEVLVARLDPMIPNVEGEVSEGMDDIGSAGVALPA